MSAGVRRPGPRRLGPALAAVVAAASVGGCGAAGVEKQTVTVLAAASLTEPFTELADIFEERHADVEVLTAFDSSATLAAQVAAGAPADVVATADPRTMDTMEDAGALRGSPTFFARNELALVVPADNPAGIDALADVAGTDFLVCAPTAPCGALAEELLESAGLTTRPRSHEVDVKAVLTKVALGEADAGLVYASDVVAAGGDVREIPLPTGATLATDYPVALTSDSAHVDLAEEFVDLLLSAEGRAVLEEAGFTASVTGRRDGGPHP